MTFKCIRYRTTREATTLLPVHLLTKGRWYSRLARAVAILVVAMGLFIAAAWFFAGPYIAGVVREKLIVLVSQQLNARLEIREIRYLFPYGVEARDAALHSTTPGEPSIKLVGFDRLNLTLGRFPLREGPLIIQRIDIQKPTFYVVEDKEHGFIGLKHLVRNSEEKAKDTSAPPKLSDFLRLRHVQLTDARVEYDDRTIRKSVPFVWDKLGLNLDSTPLKHQDPAEFHFQAGAGNGDNARVDTNGSINLDTLLLKLDSLSITTKVSPGLKNSPLPAGVQRVLNTLGVRGSGRASISGTVPILEGDKIDLGGDFVIDDAEGRLSSEGKPLHDLDVKGRVKMQGRVVTVEVGLFSCRRGTLGVSIQPTTVVYNLRTDQWTVTPVRAAAVYVPPATATGIQSQSASVLANVLVTQAGRRDEFRANLEGTTIDLPTTGDKLAVSGAVRYDDEGITIEALRADGLDGQILLAGVINENAAAIAGQLDATGLNLQRVLKLADPTSDKSIAGKLSLHVRGAATDTLDAVRGDGRFRVTGGQFAKVPILGGIAEKLNVGKKAFIAHEATGAFTLETDKAKFSRIAVNTDVFSVRGDGNVGFDGKLDLSLYADGKWYESPEKQQKELYIPGLSELGRGIKQTAGYFFGSFSRQFTHFTVTGTLDSPKLTPSPVPVVGETVDKMFGKEP